MSSSKIFRLLGLTIAWFGLAIAGHTSQAKAIQPSFGSGLDTCAAPVQPVILHSPLKITNCTQAGIQAALTTGGEIQFDCGTAPVTIPISTELQLSTLTDTVLDGGGLVTLDGQGLTRILYKGWHDPVAVGEITVTLQNLRLINGKAPAGGTTGDHSGGAIASGHPGTRLHVINVTFENNSTTDITTTDNQGGAIFSHNSYETIISGSVFRNNRAGNGGAFGGIATGLFVFNNRFSNFYNNTLNEQSLPSSTEWQGYHTNLPMTDGGLNIQFPRDKPTYNNDVNNNITANPIYLDPLLLALATNGGPTWTMALSAGSPAVNSGNPATCPMRDQRDFLRQDACDIGPYEFGGLPFIPTSWTFLPVMRHE